MKPVRTPLDDRTPRGGLDEGAIHGLLGYQLAQSTAVTKQAFERVVGKPMGLRPIEFTILQLAHENPSASPTNLARALRITTPGVKLWLDRLEKRKLIRRVPRDTDLRSHRLEVTREGTRLRCAAQKSLQASDQEVMRDLSPGERHILLELLQKVARSRGADAT